MIVPEVSWRTSLTPRTCLSSEYEGRGQPPGNVTSLRFGWYSVSLKVFSNSVQGTQHPLPPPLNLILDLDRVES